jgi:formylglycine-generating enzyme required for sulfatase activity
MKICLNPNCPKPQNPPQHNFCQNCGASFTQSFLFKERFLIEKTLGQGAFGRTYKAQDTDHPEKIPCVIKKFICDITGSAFDKAKELFIREAALLYKLNHSDIPKLYAYFDYQNSLYLVQELIEGNNLIQEIKNPQKTYNEPELIKLLTDILPVLDYLHKQNILHRDIKPDNIMYRTSDQKHILIDYGGVKQQTGTILSAAGTALYTPGYAAIEHIHGHAISASDLYSLGATCVRLLTKSFPGYDTNGQLKDPIYNFITGQWTWRQTAGQNGIVISDNLANILTKMLANYATDRYQSAEEILALLQPPKVVINPPPVSPKVVVTPPVKTIITPPQAIATPNLNSHQTFTFETKRIQIIQVPKTGWFSSGTEEQIKYISQTLKAQYIPFDLGNNIILEMVYIPGGTFTMGTDDQEIARLCKKYDVEYFKWESPQHQVTLQPYYIAKYPVTQAQWQQVAKYQKVTEDLNSDPSYFKGAKLPVESITWDQAQEFCDRLNQHFNMNQNQPNNHKFHLTTEAQWEYACRAGTKTPFYFGETITTDLANYHGNYTYGSESKGKYREQTTEVGTFPPNAFGIYDMHGNVWEWCADDWHENYQNAPIDGSAWIESIKLNNYMVICGGSWGSDPRYCRCAYRGRLTRALRNWGRGFRLFFSPFRT